MKPSTFLLSKYRNTRFILAMGKMCSSTECLQHTLCIHTHASSSPTFHKHARTCWMVLLYNNVINNWILCYLLQHSFTFNTYYRILFTYNWALMFARIFSKKSHELSFSDGLPDQASRSVPALRSHFLNAPFCYGKEASLFQCLSSGFNNSYLDYACDYEAFVTCYNLSISEYKFSLQFQKC